MNTLPWLIRAAKRSAVPLIGAAVVLAVVIAIDGLYRRELAHLSLEPPKAMEDPRLWSSYIEELSKSCLAPAASNPGVLRALADLATADRLEEPSAQTGGDRNPAIRSVVEFEAIAMAACQSHAARVDYAISRLHLLSSAANAAAMQQYHYLEQRYRLLAFHRQGAQAMVLLAVAITLVLAAIAFAIWHARGPSAVVPAAATMKFGRLELQSPAISALVLISAMAFLFLFVQSVFPLREAPVVDVSPPSAEPASTASSREEGK